MEEEYAAQDLFQDINTRIRDMEERQALLKDRLLLVGKSLIDERERNILEMQTLKKSVFILTEENTRLKELVQRIAEQVAASVRKEELMIIQRQLDLLRSPGEKNNGNH